MKFKEMSWEELQEDFKNILDSMSIKELVDSVKRYAVCKTSYQYETCYGNNLNDMILQKNINIEVKKENSDYKNVINIITEPLEINSEQYLNMEEAA